MNSNFLLYWSLFVVITFVATTSVFYYLHTKHPDYLEKIELRKFRDNLYPGIYVKLEYSNLIYKVVLVNGNYVQLHHPNKGFSGHPLESLYPVDYEF